MKEFYTRAEAARALDISRQAVTQAVNGGRITITDSGIPVDELEQWRIARIRDAALELEARQMVPSLLGDKRTRPSSAAIFIPESGQAFVHLRGNVEDEILIMQRG